MADKIVQLIDKNGDNIFPVATVANGATITMTDTDPGEGAALGDNEYIAIYGGDPIIMDYSTSEINTGAKWIDGKPIYRRAFAGTVTNAANTRVNHTLWSSSEIDNIINVGGQMSYGTSGKNFVPMCEGSNEYRLIYIQDGTNNLMLAVLSATAFTDRPYKVWVEYTKSS